MHTRIAVFAVAAFGIPTATATDYPYRPIRFIVPSAAGSAADINARLLAAELSKLLAQQIVVDNRPGAGGSIGMELTVRAVADGYTLGYGTSAALAITRSLVARMPYDTEKDMQMVALMGSQANLLAVAPSLPVKSVQGLIDYARANPGKLSYGSSGTGPPAHLSMELFKHMTGTQLVHVPYRAAQQAIAEMIAGQVHTLFDNFGSIVPHVKSGRIRGLGVTSLKRSYALPDLPTLDEAGVPGFEVTAWGGVVGPKGVARPIVTRLNAQINQALASPALKEKVALFGYEVAGGTPEYFADYVRKESAKWAEVIKRAGVKAD